MRCSTLVPCTTKAKVCPRVMQELPWYRKAATQGDKEALERVTELEEATKPSTRLEPGGCANCGGLWGPNGAAALKPCARCKTAVYCGRDCQKKHYKASGGHQDSCSTTE